MLTQLVSTLLRHLQRALTKLLQHIISWACFVKIIKKSFLGFVFRNQILGFLVLYYRESISDRILYS